MARRCFLFCIVLFLVFPFSVFSQQGASGLRDYVGLINQSYHPGVVAIFEKLKQDFQKQGDTDAVKSIDIFLSGAFGSGFLYSDAGGNIYVITNNHVVAQSYTLSITFESTDGTKRKYENLRIIAVDEEKDIAILAFPDGDKPSGRGLTFLERAVDEGEDVYSAGFPGLGITPLWQFGRGMVSNASARFPKSINDETLMGPFIQHTAQIDAGNSGGPLLIAQSGVQGGYAVVGINTLSGTYRQAANYAVPASVVLEFINRALNQKPDAFRAELDARLEKFMEGLKGNNAIYPHIAEFLSSACVGENAEFAIEEMSEKGSSSIRRAFNDKCEESVVGAMGYAVAWTIENSLRPRTGGAINASLKEISGSGDEYTVVFTVNNTDVSSVWVREYGNWRIKTFGSVATGDQSRIEQRQSQREAAAKLRLNGDFFVSLGFSTAFFGKPMDAIYASFEVLYFGLQLSYVNSNLFSFGGFIAYNVGIPAGNFGFIPYLRVGMDYLHDGSRLIPGSLPVGAQVGLKVTTSYVPGLFIGIGAGVQLNFFTFDLELMERAVLHFTAGYTF